MAKEKTTKKKTTKKEKKSKVKSDTPIDIDISLVVDNLQKVYGKNVIVSPKDKEEINRLKIRKNFMPTGSLSLDRMTGIGGLPLGRIIEVFGPEGKGKTSLCVICCAMLQRFYDAFILYVDAEHRLDLDYAQMLGMNVTDPNKFLIIKPDNSEQVFSSINKVLSLNKRIGVIIDSVPAVLPTAEAVTEFGESKAMALQAREMGEFLRKVNPKISKNLSLCMFTNQMRTKKAGKIWFQAASGGKALPYYSTIRINIKWGKDDFILDDNGNSVGAYMRYNFEKTNTSAPPKPRKICFKFGRGFWKELELVEIGVQECIIEQAGSWYSWGEYKAQGKNNFMTLFEDDKKLAKQMEKEIKEKWGMKT